MEEWFWNLSGLGDDSRSSRQFDDTFAWLWGCVHGVFLERFPRGPGPGRRGPDEFVSTLYVPRERKEEVVLAEYESPSASPGTTWFGGSSVWEALASAVEDDVEKSGRRETPYWENYDITVSLRPDLVDARECVRVPPRPGRRRD